MDLLKILFPIVIFGLISCGEESEGNGGETFEENGTVEIQQPATPEQSDRDPNAVYVDTEFLPFSNGVATFADRIFARTIKYHQFEIEGGEIIDIRVSSESDQSLVSILGPGGQRFVRTAFGGPDGDFLWNERFHEPGKYTVQVSLQHEFAVEGGSTSYDLTIRNISE